MSDKIYLEEWLKEIPAVEHDNDDVETDWEKSKEWWEPYVYLDEADGEKEISWLCDHVGDAQDVMEELWNEVLRLRDLIKATPKPIPREFVEKWKDKIISIEIGGMPANSNSGERQGVIRIVNHIKDMLRELGHEIEGEE